MDAKHFDELLRANAYTPSSRRTVSQLLAGGALAGAMARLGLAEDAAAKRKTKKRKKQATRCMTVRESCAGSACCGGLGCGDNGCDGGNVCYLHEGGDCWEDCDCRGDLNCSERRGYTCQHCAYPETLCWTTSDCCLDTSICGYNGCDDYNTVCCQWEIGSFCYDDCDCCGELGCFGNMCLPLLTADGGTQRTQANSEPETQRPAKGAWPRREAVTTRR
jgi:hypothetical protein